MLLIRLQICTYARTHLTSDLTSAVNHLARLEIPDARQPIVFERLAQPSVCVLAGHLYPAEHNMSKLNTHGGLYYPGKASGAVSRENVVQLYTTGKSLRQIGDICRLSAEGVRKIVNRYLESGTYEPKANGLSRERHSVITTSVLQHIELYKQMKPSMYLKEIKQQLLDDGVCTLNNVPSIQSISHALLGELNMTRKVLAVTPEEKMKNEDLFDTYLAKLALYPASKQHHFDEASVIRTSGNRRYGHSYKGTRAVEVQKYASNSTYTVNLLVGYFGIDSYEVLDGPSNGLHMTSFFDEVVASVNDLGNPILARGDCVIMDNCGFHHGRQTERYMRTLMQNCGVELIFQPPYSPELNVCECVFGNMKHSLKEDSKFTYDFTELAITNALGKVNGGLCRSWFTRCGYINY
jgi:transposase